MKGSRKVSFSVWEKREKKTQWLSPATRQTHSQNPRRRAPRHKSCVCLHPEKHEHLVVGEPWKTKQHFPGCVLRLRTALYFMKNRFHGEQHRATLQPLSLSPGNRQNIMHKSREPRVSCLNPGKTSRDLLQHVSRPDSPTMAREQ